MFLVYTIVMGNEIKKVLIMEDDEKIRATMCDFFLTQKFDVFQAKNGKSGYELALECIPDIIISDIFMPEVDGYELLEKLKENPLTENIPFIFLSTISGPAALRLSKELGANCHLVKPFAPGLTLQVINHLFGSK